MLDHTTVFAMQGGLLLVMGAIILFAYIRHRPQHNEGSAPWLASGYILAGVGLGLLALEHHVSTRVIIPTGNTLFLLFSAFAGRAFARATGNRNDPFYPLAATAGLVIAAFIWWQPSGLALSLGSALATTLLYTAVIVPLLRPKDLLIRPALRAVVALFVLEIFITLLRLLIWRYTRTTAWFPGMNIITTAGVALAYLWMNHLRWSAQLERTAMTDPLTGLSNRRAVEIFGLRDLLLASGKDQPSSALMIDLDRFKQLNDQHGHRAGDASLCAVADAVLAAIRPGDIAARFGGDEFFILLPGTGEAAAAALAQALDAAVQAIHLTAPNGEPYTVAASIGAATLAGDKATLEDLLHTSDIMLYRQKQFKRSQREFAILAMPDEDGARPTAQ